MAAHAAKVMNVIYTEGPIGKGSDGDPIRTVKQFWTLTGELLGQCDPYMDEKRAKEESTRGAGRILSPVDSTPPELA